VPTESHWPVLYVDGEAVPQLLNARAESWGMDRDRLYLMLPDERRGLIDFGADAEQARLTQMCHDLDPCFVVVDSLGAVSARGENSVEEVRDILSFLGAVAREFDLALLLIHHLRKKGKLAPPTDLVSIDEFRGSSHIVAIARSVLALSVIQSGPQPDRNGPRQLEVVKTNLGRYPPPLGVLLVPPPGSTEEEDGVPRLRYTEPPKSYRPPTQVDECAAWLVEYLEHAQEPRQPKHVLAAAMEAGFTRTTVYRARKRLGGKIVEIGTGLQDPYKRWALASGGPLDPEG